MRRCGGGGGGGGKNAYKNRHRKRPLKRHFVGKTSSGIDVARGAQKEKKPHSPNGIRVFTFSKPKSPLAISAPGEKAKRKNSRDVFSCPSVVIANRNRSNFGR